MQQQQERCCLQFTTKKGWAKTRYKPPMTDPVGAFATNPRINALSMTKLHTRPREVTRQGRSALRISKN